MLSAYEVTAATTIRWSTCVISAITASCPINSKGSLRLPNVAFRRSMNTMSLMAFSKTPGPKLTCGFPVRTKVLQLPGSFATFVTLLLPRSRTLSAWVKGNWSTSRGSVNGAISGQRGPVRPHLAALSVTNFPHPAKGLRRSCARLNCGVSDTSKKRSSGHWHCHSIDTSIGLKGSNCWKRSNATCILTGQRVRSLTIRPSLLHHQTRPFLPNPAPSTFPALPRISAHQTRPCLTNGAVVARWSSPRLPGHQWLLYLWDRVFADPSPWTRIPTGLQRGCGADGDSPTPCSSPKGPCDTRKVVQVPLQFWFLYSQTSEHHLERFLLGAPFSFSFIHSISDAWDLRTAGSRFYSTRQFQKLGGGTAVGDDWKLNRTFFCFHFLVEMLWHEDVAISVST